MGMQRQRPQWVLSIWVADTESSNADAVVEQTDGQLLFVQPWEQEEPFRDILNYIRDQDPYLPRGPIKYAQTQNDNLKGEYKALLADVPGNIPWARIALEKDPDAVNMWLGNNHSVTSLHKDDYENIYAQIRGQKSFFLLPPIMAPCVNEQVLSTARYEWTAPIFGKDIERDVHDLKPKLCEPTQTVPWPTWDPEQPHMRATSLSCYGTAMKIALEAGDMLYLPAMWYHKVSQEVGDEGFSCSINYWYDMDFDGPFWATTSLIRDISGLTHSATDVDS